MYKFTIKNGLSPESIDSPLYVRAGDQCMLVFDKIACVGIIWEHYEKRKAAANGQAEIRFFDRYKNRYNVWHRMFVNRQRICYNALKEELQRKNEYVYFCKIKGKNNA